MDFSSWLDFGGKVQETKRASGAAVDRVFTAPDGAALQDGVLCAQMDAKEELLLCLKNALTPDR